MIYADQQGSVHAIEVEEDTPKRVSLCGKKMVGGTFEYTSKQIFLRAPCKECLEKWNPLNAAMILGGLGEDYLVEFVSYDGKYPNLCSGELIIRVNGVLWTFEKHSLSSGGSAGFKNDYSEEYVTSGPWRVSDWPEGFPEDMSLRDRVVEVVNSHVGFGCCGGCL